jgi:cyclopropane fatty-acyl-phospholipid synthase-like methyltransferase
MTQPNAPGELDAEKVNELARCFWYSAMLRAGIKLGAFDLLDTGDFGPDDVADRISASSRYVRAFLDGCVALDLLVEREGTYTNSLLASKYLVRGKKEYVGDHALHHTNTWALWGRLDEIMKQDETQLPFETGFVDATTYWTNYMMGQHNRAASGQAHYLVENVNLQGRRKLLDLGGGMASYSIAFCGANPQLRAVVADQKEPLDLAKPLVEEHSLQDRITLLEGDFLTLDLGLDFDVVLISGVVLIKSEEECRHLLELAYDCLVPGGLVIVQDYMRIDYSPERRRLDALENMYVKVAFDPGAEDRDGQVVAHWLQETGFANPTLIPLPTQLALVTGEKPV